MRPFTSWETETQTEEVRLIYDGITYLNDVQLRGEVDMIVDATENLALKFLQNTFQINDLKLTLNGQLSMPEDDILMDLQLASPSTEFSSILSLVPGVYTEAFNAIKTDGQLAFDAFAKGTYNENSLPGFGLNLNIQDGFLQYPDLPTPVSNIGVILSVDCPDGDLDQMLLDLNKLYADLGNNPLAAQARIKGLENMQVNGMLKANLNLAELTQMFPIEATTLRGQFMVDATANGVYNEAEGSFPQVDARMSLEEGYMKNEDYPSELEDLQFHGRFTDPNGTLSAAEIDIPDFHFTMDGKAVDGSVYLKDFDNPFYRLKANGTLDLEKIMEIYPIDSMTLRGIVELDQFETEGRYADLEAERYDQLKASGQGRIENLFYSDLWYVQPGFAIDKGDASFTADKLILRNASGRLGKSDFAGGGYLDNYLAYGLMPNQPLGGNLSLSSRQLDVNEWMAVEEGSAAETSSTPEEEEAWEVIPVPDYLDLSITATIGEVIYDDLKLENFSGILTIADEEIDMENIRFDMLGSQFAMNGYYETRDLKKPAYNFYLNIADLAVENAYEYFSPVKAFAPALAFINGIANTELGLKGHLKEDMSPVLEDIYGLGSFLLKKGEVKDAPLFIALADKTKLNALRDFKFEDVQGKFEIVDGFLIIAPIDLEYQGIKLQLSGRQSLGGNLDYLVSIDAPSGSIGDQAFQALNGLSGGLIQTSDRVIVNLLVGGTAKAPEVRGAGGGTGEAVKDQLTEAAEDQLEGQLGVDIDLEKDSLQAQADQLKQQATDSARQALEQAQKQAEDSLRAIAEQKKLEAQQALEEQARQQLGDSVVNKLKGLKDRFGLPKKKKDRN